MNPRSFARAVTRWFRAGGRDLPWRRTRHPYRVWVSEIMLQQTRIETVIPYYRRFVSRFPTVRDLAGAKLDEVLKLWEGLGYYARARNLHRSAQRIVTGHGGRFPETADEWLTLPGVGEYTAAAIVSITLGIPAPVIDGNVRRVAARLLNDAKPHDLRILDTLAVSIEFADAGDFNQGVMELGQRICTPRAPLCLECPVRRHCAAHAAGTVDRVPARKPRKAVPHYEIAIGVCSKGSRILVSRRKEDDMLGGLWEFPGGKIREGESEKRAVAREFLEEVGIRVDVGEKLITVPHKYSHFSVNLHTYLCRHVSGRPRAIDCAEVRWVDRGCLSELAFPTANRRILDALGEESGNRH